jgi:hypothetical protein
MVIDKPPAAMLYMYICIAASRADSMRAMRRSVFTLSTHKPGGAERRSCPRCSAEVLVLLSWGLLEEGQIRELNFAIHL